MIRWLFKEKVNPVQGELQQISRLAIMQIDYTLSLCEKVQNQQKEAIDKIIKLQEELS